VGLATGDKLTKINGKTPSDFTDLKLASALAAPGEQIDLVVDRPEAGGKSRQLEFRIEPIKDPITGMFYLGIGQPVSLQLAALTTSDRALKAAGVNADMRISAVDGKPIDAFWQFERAVREDGEHHRKVQLTFTDGKSTATVAFAPLTDLSMSEGPADRPNLLGLVPPAQVMDVSPHMPADGKLQIGDVIVSVNGHKWPSSTEASKLIAASTGAANFTVLRDGKPVEVTVKPDRGSLGMSKPLVGVVISQAMDTNLISGVLSGSPLAPLKLTPQSRILSIDGQPIHSYPDLRTAVEESAGTIHVAYQLPLGDRQWQQAVTIPPAAMAKLRSLRWSLGEQTPLLEPAMVLQQAGSLGEAVQMGFAKTDLFLEQTYVTLVRLAQRTVPASEMRGPIGILEAGTKVTRQGVAYLMFFLGLISINLSVINFLPMPIVDGGLFVLLVIEKLRGKPVPPQVANAINLVGIVLLGSVFLFVTYHDIARMVTGARML
jgi:regulator of sigma E protease